MNLQTIQKRIYRRCGLSDTPPSADVTRILDFINEWYREVLASPGMDQLRDTTLTFTTAANQKQYGLPQAIARIRDIYDVTNQRRVYEKSLDWLRMTDPGLSAVSSTVENWIPLNGWGAVNQPLTSTGVGLWVAGATDAGKTAYIEGTRLGGIRGGTASVVIGASRTQIGTLTDWIEVTKFYISAAITDTVSLLDAGSGGNTLSLVTPGRTSARYYMLQLYPTPSAAITLSVDCQRSMEDLVNPTEEPIFPEDFHWLLVYGPLSDEMVKRDSTLAAQYAARAAKIKSDLRHHLFGNPDEIPVQRGPYRTPQGTSRLGGWFPRGS